MGTAFHSYIASYYGKPLSNEDIEQINSLDPEALETVHKMYDTYVEEVEQDGLDVGQVTLDLELRIEKQLLPDLTLSGQIDHIYKDENDGAIVIQDTKTVAQTFETAARDFQLMTYLWLVYDQYPDQTLFAIEHNVVKRNKRTGRSKPPYIQRNRHYHEHSLVATAYRPG